MEKNNKINILLVDNDEMMRIYFRDIFWIHGRSEYDITMASTLDEAESKLSGDYKPNTIFLDIMMHAEGKGNSPHEQIEKCISFIERIKKDKDLNSTKIIIFSSHREKSTEESVCRAGADGYLIKGDLMPKEIIAFTDKIHGSNH